MLSNQPLSSRTFFFFFLSRHSLAPLEIHTKYTTLLLTGQARITIVGYAARCIPTRLRLAPPRRASGDSEDKTRREIAEIGGKLPHITIHSYRLIVFLISQKDYVHYINKHFNFPFRGKDRRSCPPSCFRLLPRLAPLLPSEERKGAEASKKAGGQTSLGIHRDAADGGNTQHTLRVCYVIKQAVKFNSVFFFSPSTHPGQAASRWQVQGWSG